VSRLSGRERRRLRALGQSLAATLHIGHEGVTDAVVAQAEAQLTAHGLIKVRMSENASAPRAGGNARRAHGRGARAGDRADGVAF
jgi:RNA-binding protein YhbY